MKLRIQLSGIILNSYNRPLARLLQEIAVGQRDVEDLINKRTKKKGDMVSGTCLWSGSKLGTCCNRSLSAILRHPPPLPGVLIDANRTSLFRFADPPPPPLVGPCQLFSLRERFLFLFRVFSMTMRLLCAFPNGVGGLRS